MPDVAHGMLWGLCKAGDSGNGSTEKQAGCECTSKSTDAQMASRLDIGGEASRQLIGLQASPKDGDAINCNLETSSPQFRSS